MPRKRWVRLLCRRPRNPISLGKLQLTVLHDAQFVVPNDGKTFGIDAKAGEVTAVLGAAAVPTDRVTLSVNVLMVKTGSHIVLLDTGLGPKAHGMLLSSLQRTGVAPAAVTDILITHSHGDHIGGLLDANDKLAFPNARIRMSAAEWAWLQKQGPAQLVAAIAANIETFAPGATVVAGIRSRALPGHTPGHVGYEVSAERRRICWTSAIWRTAPSFRSPGRNGHMGFDTRSGAEQRHPDQDPRGLGCRPHALIYAPFTSPFPGVGHLVPDGDGFKWQPATP